MPRVPARDDPFGLRVTFRGLTTPEGSFVARVFLVRGLSATRVASGSGPVSLVSSDLTTSGWGLAVEPGPTGPAPLLAGWRNWPGRVGGGAPSFSSRRTWSSSSSAASRARRFGSPRRFLDAWVRLCQASERYTRLRVRPSERAEVPRSRGPIAIKASNTMKIASRGPMPRISMGRPTQPEMVSWMASGWRGCRGHRSRSGARCRNHRSWRVRRPH